MQRLDNRRTNESLQLLIIRHWIPQLLKYLHHTTNDARIRLGQCAVKVKQNDFLGLLGLLGHEINALLVKCSMQCELFR